MKSVELLKDLSSYLPKEEVEALGKSLELEPYKGLVLNPNKIDEASLLEAYPFLEKIPEHPLGYRYIDKEYGLGKSLLFDLGAFYMQDPSAMLVSAFLNPKFGAHVLDMCAAPGGKTIGLSLLRKDVTILSNDLSYPRARELSGNVERMGLDNVVVTSCDLSLYQKVLRESFDAILLDAPCSGSAMFRKSSAVKEDWSKDKVLRCASIQHDLLELAYSFLAPGGKLLYSTCSFSKEEDIDQINAFVSAHKDMVSISLPDHEGFYHHPDCKDAIYLFPHHYKGEGQFLCLLQKEGIPTERNLTPAACPKQLKDFAKNYGLGEYDFFVHKEIPYALAHPFPRYSLPLLRRGIKLLENDKPDFALARALPASYSIPLNEKQAHDYLLGLSFPLVAPKGFSIVSYKGMNLGFVKVSDGVAKNHYPKGLRHDYPLPLLPF